MASRKLLLLCTLLIFLSLAHSALADRWFYKKPPKKHGGYYNGMPFDDEDGGEYNSNLYDEYNQKQPYYTQPFYKPAFPFKYKPFQKHAPAIHKRKPIAYKPQPPQVSPPAQQCPPVYKPPHAAPPMYKPPQNTPSPKRPIYKPPPKAPAPMIYRPRPSPSTQPQTPAYTPSSSLQKQWLDPHNAARAELGLPPMVWSDKVAQYAEWWANQRKASGCGLQHSDGPYGENIFWGSGGGYGPAECVAAWVSEKQYYNYADNSCASGQQCGHYTQIVWASSVNLGCARVQCDSGQIFMTCNYDPPGNWIGSKPY